MGQVTTGDGETIHYETDGPDDGPPLVFSNSLGTNLHMWDGQVAAALAHGFRVIRYDQRGHGKSAMPIGAYTLARLVEDVIDVIDALKLDRVAFCGISMGGMTGMRLAKRHPNRVSRIALCNTAAHMAPTSMWDARIKAVSDGGMQAVVDAVVERWFTRTFRDTEPAEVDRIRAQVLSTPPAGYTGCCHAIRDMDERDGLDAIRMPTLVVIGAQDPATTPEHGRFVAGQIPGARQDFLDAAHLSNVERPQDFNRIVLGFLAGGKT